MIIDEDSTTQWILEDDDLIVQDLSNLQLTNSEEEPYYSILCVDIGVVNLGLAALIGDPLTLKFRRVVGIDLLDITKIPHPPEIPECTCTLNHSRTFTDWMEHIFQYYREVFEGVDKIILERQPPMGFVVVEQLIYSKYRSKCELISPVSMHKFFGMGGDYEQRKEMSVQLGRGYIESNSQIEREFVSFSRQHDITDAILMGVFWFHTEHRKYLELEHQKYISSLIIRTNDFGGCPREMNIDDFLSQFRFKPLN